MNQWREDWLREKRTCSVCRVEKMYKHKGNMLSGGRRYVDDKGKCWASTVCPPCSSKKAKARRAGK